VSISLILVFDQLWISGQILVNVQEQAAQHNPFLNIQTLGNPLVTAQVCSPQELMRKPS
jgi:hypothetical protein